MIGMLARAAENIYWLGRYLERAESAARITQCMDQLSLEIRGLDADLAMNIWTNLQDMFPGSLVKGSGSTNLDDITETSLRSFLVSYDNQLSVAYSIRSARENARVIRENLTRETFVLLNECHLRLQSCTNQAGLSMMEMRSILSSIRQEIFGIQGAIKQTFTRDEGLLFLDMGSMMERAYRTLLLLEVKLPFMLSATDQGDLPVYYARIRAALKAVASLENYRRIHGADLDPKRVARFLLFDRRTPHSVHVCLRELKQHLEELEIGAPLTNPARMLGKITARLEYEEQEILSGSNLDVTCKKLATDINEVHDALSRLYFTV